MKTIYDIPDLKGKRVLLRVDFDVPVSPHSQILEPFRIKRQKETLDYLVKAGAKIVMAAHISATDSFTDLIPQLHILLGYEIGFIKNIESIQDYLKNYSVPGLLENIRQFAGEKENDNSFAQSLARGFDLYINNAFAVCHRKQTSVSAITKYLPSYAGTLIQEEVAQLNSVMRAPSDGKVIIMGGAKASTKIPVIKNFIDKTEKILIGGVIANDILKKKGQDVGESLVDENVKELLSGLDLNNPKLVMPSDYNISENKILDIGPESIDNFSEILKNAKTIIWNGPMGLFENDKFATGTKAVAQVIANSSAFKLIGGGDTITAIDKFGLSGRFDFVSTGGGAMLAFLAGEKLPGLEALKYYE